MVSLSRGGWLAAAASLVWFFGILMFQRGYRLPALLALSLILAVTLVAIPRSFALKLRMRRMVSEQGQVNDGLRFALWQPAFQLWQENPWWGAGPAHFNSRFHAYRPEGVQLSPERAHNDYLNTLADWGLVGTVLVASAWVLLGFGVAGSWSSIRLSSGDLGGKSGSNKFAFVVGASGGLVAILVHSLVDFNMHIPANAILVVTLMALISGHLRFATERWWSRLGLTGKALASVILLAGVSCLAFQAWIQVSEFIWIEKAKRVADSPVDRIASLKRAYAADPKNPETTYRIAQAYQQESQEGGTHYAGQEGVNYQRLAEQAMEWFQRGMKLNPWDSRNYTGYGWCLDWLDRAAESPSYFAKAEELDPNSYFNLNRIGLHYVQLGDFAAAKPWFERSLRLEWKENTIAQNYLQIANRRLLEAATNTLGVGNNLIPR
jgi:hypothetical protein